MSQPAETTPAKAVPVPAEDAAPSPPPANAEDAAATTATTKEEPTQLPNIEETTSAAESPQPQQPVPETAPNNEHLPEHIRNEPNLCLLLESLPSVLKTVEHQEMWGVELKDHNDIPTINVLQKFLRANDGDVKTAEEHLTKALLWRKEFKPLECVDAVHSKKFDGLGFVTTYPDAERAEVFTWNIYGAVGSNFDAVFGDVKEYVFFLSYPPYPYSGLTLT